MRRASVGIRLDVLGKPEVIQALRQAGREGEVMANRIDRSGRTASRGLLAVDRSAKLANQQLQATAARAGAVGDVLSGMGRIGLVAAAGIAAIGIAAVATGRKAVDAAREIASIGDAADRAGVAAETFEKITAAVVNSGQKTEGLEASISKFQRTLGDARAGNQGAIDTFGALGISLAELSDQSITAEEMLLRVADGFARMDDPARQAALGQRLFEEGGRALVPVLAEGRQGLQDLFSEAESLGQLYGGDLIRSSQKLSAEMDRQSQIISVQLNKAFVQMAPLITGLLEPLADLARRFLLASTEAARFFGVLKETRFVELTNSLGTVNTEIAATEQALQSRQERVARLQALGAPVGALLEREVSDLQADLAALNARREGLGQQLISLSQARQPGRAPDLKLAFNPSSSGIESATVGGRGAGPGGLLIGSADQQFFRQLGFVPTGDVPKGPSARGGVRADRARERELDRSIAALTTFMNRGAEEAKRNNQRLERERERQLDAFADLRVQGLQEGTKALAEFVVGVRSGTDVLQKFLTDLATDLPALLFGGQASTGVGGLLQTALGGASKGLFADTGLDSFIGGLFGPSEASFSIGGGLGSSFLGADLSFLPGFSTGGSFDVTPANSLRLPPRGGDDRFVPIRAQIGENIKVTRRGERPGQAMNQTITIIVEGDANDATVDRLRRVARDELSLARPGIVGEAVAATGVELVQNPDFGR